MIVVIVLHFIIFITKRSRSVVDNYDRDDCPLSVVTDIVENVRKVVITITISICRMTRLCLFMVEDDVWKSVVGHLAVIVITDVAALLSLAVSLDQEVIHGRGLHLVLTSIISQLQVFKAPSDTQLRESREIIFSETKLAVDMDKP